jgi:hypothetical protein
MGLRPPVYIADELREKLREKLTVLKQNAEGVYEAEEEES